MIRNLLATTAIATLLASGAYAQETTTPAPAEPAPMTQDAAPATADATTAVDGHLASKIIGETVYNGTGDDAENIGEVNDIVLNAEGNIESIVIGVGGFLGIGEKSVAVEFSEVDWAERDGDRWLVIAATKEQLEQQAAFDPAPYEPAPAAVATDTTAPAGTMAPVDPAAPATDTAEAPADPAAPATDDTAAAPADPAAPATDTAEAPAADPAAPATDTAEAPAVDPAAPATDDTAAATAPADPAAPAATDATQTAAIDRTTLTEVPVDQITSENLVGTTVYGADDANVGEIGDVVLQDEKVDAVIIDVGGFLGVGEKPVAVAMDKLAFMKDADDNMYLYTTFTKEQLDAAAAYDESTYAENRDQQRLMMQ